MSHISDFIYQGTISIGGAHIKTGKPLPQDLQRFLDESKSGVIYFSLGTVVQSSKLPEGTIDAFLSKIYLSFFAYIHENKWKSKL